ncbi:hypothetical protein [Cystobacter fuscus]|uniref:hypothetical protein n=1 Tax=Cystobacter fuscus TaxID=43 RepID=UPI000BB3B53B|nr:hypothetical protein [Cystobacter fuscus]
MVRVLLADPTTRRHYLTVGIAQAVVIVALVVMFSRWKNDVAHELGKRTGVELWLVYSAAILSSLQLFQWIVIALSRDHHTVLSREASVRTGLEPEDEPLTPRVWLNIPWLKKKLKQRWRALWLFAWGVPVLWVADRLGRIMYGNALGETGLMPLLASLWGAWWFVVFTAGKSERAWTQENARAPWFLRAWDWLGSRIAPLGAYGRRWARVTHPVFSPAACVEQRPWGLMGLALARAVSALPLVRCFLRPTIPVAAAHLLAAEDHPARSANPPASALAAVGALAPDAAPASPPRPAAGARPPG